MPADDPLWTHGKQKKQDVERDHRLVIGRNVTTDQRVDHAEQQSANQCSEQAPESA